MTRQQSKTANVSPHVFLAWRSACWTTPRSVSTTFSANRLRNGWRYFRWIWWIWEWSYIGCSQQRVCIPAWRSRIHCCLFTHWQDHQVRNVTPWSTALTAGRSSSTTTASEIRTTWWSWTHAAEQHGTSVWRPYDAAFFVSWNNVTFSIYWRWFCEPASSLDIKVLWKTIFLHKPSFICSQIS